MKRFVVSGFFPKDAVFLNACFSLIATLNCLLSDLCTGWQNWSFVPIGYHVIGLMVSQKKMENLLQKLW